jgi:pectinesterase
MLNETTGIVLQNCRIKAAGNLKTIKDDNYLGRPWKQYARVVIMESYIDKLISPKGWIRWNTTPPPSTIYFAKYANSGPGASTAKRVNWQGYHVFTRKQARKFTSKRFIHADQWMPNRTIPYYVGFTN